MAERRHEAPIPDPNAEHGPTPGGDSETANPLYNEFAGYRRRLAELVASEDTAPEDALARIDQIAEEARANQKFQETGPWAGHLEAQLDNARSALAAREAAGTHAERVSSARDGVHNAAAGRREPPLTDRRQRRLPPVSLDNMGPPDPLKRVGIPTVPDLTEIEARMLDEFRRGQSAEVDYTELGARPHGEDPGVALEQSAPTAERRERPPVQPERSANPYEVTDQSQELRQPEQVMVPKRPGWRERAIDRLGSAARKTNEALIKFEEFLEKKSDRGEEIMGDATEAVAKGLGKGAKTAYEGAKIIGKGQRSSKLDAQAANPNDESVLPPPGRENELLKDIQDADRAKRKAAEQAGPSAAMRAVSPVSPSSVGGLEVRRVGLGEAANESKIAPVSLNIPESGGQYYPDKRSETDQAGVLRAELEKIRPIRDPDARHAALVGMETKLATDKELSGITERWRERDPNGTVFRFNNVLETLKNGALEEIAAKGNREAPLGSAPGAAEAVKPDQLVWSPGAADRAKRKAAESEGGVSESGRQGSELSDEDWERLEVLEAELEMIKNMSDLDARYEALRDMDNRLATDEELREIGVRWRDRGPNDPVFKLNNEHSRLVDEALKEKIALVQEKARGQIEGEGSESTQGSEADLPDMGPVFGDKWGYIMGSSDSGERGEKALSVLNGLVKEGYIAWGLNKGLVSITQLGLRQEGVREFVRLIEAAMAKGDIRLPE
ncbi:MAG: hypothetical protein JWN01_12 [Patescibacteria group bacterium]|nr:hypothetical protein [Patescibacteria group bacterium]